MPLTDNDSRVRRCPMLGHEVPFSYCRHPGTDLPCRKVFDCWWETFDVQHFLAEHLSEQQLQLITLPRPDKLFTLVQLIEKARQNGSHG